MKRHVKIYLRFFGYGEEDFIPCEVCGAKAVDIHHIDCRGMGGSKEKDDVENLMALCRSCHVEYGDKKGFMDFLRQKHKSKLDNTRSGIINNQN